MSTYLDICRTQLPVDEARRSKPYVDTVGKTSIGVGRNLTDVGLYPDEINLMFENDLAKADRVAREIVPTFDTLSEARKAVLVNMAFIMEHKLAAFVQMLKAVTEGRFDDAADEMLNSTWAKQVGQRAQRLARAMREG